MGVSQRRWLDCTHGAKLPRTYSEYKIRALVIGWTYIDRNSNCQWMQINDVIRKSYAKWASSHLMALDHAFYCIPSFCIRSFYHLSNIDWWIPCKLSLWLHRISWKNHTLSAFHILSFMQQLIFISRIVLHRMRLTRISQTYPKHSSQNLLW